MTSLDSPAGGVADDARAAAVLAEELLEAGELEACVATCDQACLELREPEDSGQICDVLIVKALALNELGLSAEAMDSLSMARELAAGLADRTHLYWVLNRVGVVHQGMGEFGLAQDFMLRALDLAKDLDGDVQFCILNNLADNAAVFARHQREQGEAAAAALTVAEGMAFGRRALPLARERPTRYREVLILDNLGMLLGLAGRFEEAQEMLETARALAAENGYHSVDLHVRWHVGAVLLLEGRAAEAEPQLAEVLDLVQGTDDLALQLRVLQDLSDAHELTGRFEAALRRYKEHIALTRTRQSVVAASRARVLVTHVDLDVARLDAADARTESELYLARSRELEAEKQALERRALELDRQAHQDALTGLSNRHHLDRELPRLMQVARRQNRALAVAVLDIDHFKLVNDTFGHAVGDAVLVQVAALLTENGRAGDLIARLGGEEFLLALLDLDLPAAAAVCERLRDDVQAHHWAQLRPDLRVEVSVGVSVLAGEDGPEDLIGRADAALYRAKRAGRNRVETQPE